MISDGQPPAAHRILLGCISLSMLPSRRAAFRLLDTAVQCGIRHFDTARAYGRGFSERVLGEFLAGHGDTLEVTTKLGDSRDRLALVPPCLALPLNALRRKTASASQTTGPAAPVAVEPTRIIHRAEVEQSIERSLRCLRRRWIDVFLLHEALPRQLDDAARDLIATLRQEGTIRKFGIGTARSTIEAFYRPDPLCEVLQYDCPQPESQSLLRAFPSVMHVHHSLFRRIGPFDRAEVIQEALSRNPAGKIIFGTTRPDHLRQNVSLIS